MTAFCDPNLATAQELSAASGIPATVLHGLDELRDHLTVAFDEEAVVLGPGVSDGEAFALADYMRVYRPSLGVILVRVHVSAATLAEGMRAGVRDVVHLHDVEGLRTAIARSLSLALTLRDSSPTPAVLERARGTLVTVFSAKGGCGKTTLATNLAASLADRGRREVCLVDLDLAFGDVSITLQLIPAHTIADAIPLAGTLDFTGLSALLTPHSPGLTTLVAPIEPGTAERISSSLVTNILDLLCSHFDYVVVDTPPAFDDVVLAALDLSDVVALIATLDVPALKNLKITMQTLDLLNYPRERCHVVLNRADSKVGLTLGEVEKSLRATIASQIPSSRDVPSSINRGVPIMLDEPRHAVSLAIRTFGERYVTTVGANRSPVSDTSAAAGTDRRGFLRKRRTRTS